MNRPISAASNIAAAALAHYLLAGPASAASLCAQPQDMAALQAAALRQELMVAALSCRAADDFNLFVTTYRDELLTSDRALKAFFLRQGARKGEAAYDAYKTRLANAASLRSLHDPRFCRNAKMVFDVALKRSGAHAALKSERPRPIATGYMVCSPGAAKTMVADAAPRPPARRIALLENSSSLPVPKAAPRRLHASPRAALQRVAMVEANAAPIPAPTQRIVSERLPPVPVAEPAAPEERASARVSPPRDFSEFNAGDGQSDAQIADNGERDDFAGDATGEYDDADDGAPRYVPRYAYAQQSRAYGRRGGYSDGYENSSYANDRPVRYRGDYNAPYGDLPDAFKPGAYWIDADRPPARQRMIRGRDGHWYLMVNFGR